MRTDLHIDLLHISHNTPGLGAKFPGTFDSDEKYHTPELTVLNIGPPICTARLLWLAMQYPITQLPHWCLHRSNCATPLR